VKKRYSWQRITWLLQSPKSKKQIFDDRLIHL